MKGKYFTCNRINNDNNPQGIGKGTGRLGNKRTSRYHPNYSIVENGQNTEKSPGDLRRLAATQTNADVKNSQKCSIIMMIDRLID